MEFTPEPISAIAMAIAAIIAALGGRAIKQGYSAGKTANPEDKLLSALEANTAGLVAMVDQFRHNNLLFLGMGVKLDQVNEHLKDIERVQVNIHSELIRGSSHRGNSNNSRSGN